MSGHRRAAAVAFVMTEGALGPLAERGLRMRGGPAADVVFADLWPHAREVARLEKAARKAAKRKARKAAKRLEARAVEFRQAAMEGVVNSWAQPQVQAEEPMVEVAPAAMDGLVARWAEAGVRARFVELDALRWTAPRVLVDQAAERGRRPREAA